MIFTHYFWLATRFTLLGNFRGSFLNWNQESKAFDLRRINYFCETLHIVFKTKLIIFKKLCFAILSVFQLIKMSWNSFWSHHMWVIPRKNYILNGFLNKIVRQKSLPNTGLQSHFQKLLFTTKQRMYLAY